MTKRATLEPIAEATLNRLYEEAREEIISNTQYLPHSKQKLKAIREAPILDLLHAYAGWAPRILSKRRRRVYLAKELAETDLDHEARVYLDDLVFDIETGEDLRPFHSKAALKFVYPLPKKSRQMGRAQDLMLNAWGIHHLHLSSRPEKPLRLAERSGTLVFGIFRPTQAFLLSTGKHGDSSDSGDWTNEELVRIAIRNWGLRELFPALKGIHPPKTKDTLTREEVKELRLAGINHPIICNDTVHMPVQGLTTLGTSMRSGDAVSEIKEVILSYAQAPEGFVSRVNPHVKRVLGNELSIDELLSFILLPDGWGLHAPMAGIDIRLGWF